MADLITELDIHGLSGGIQDVCIVLLTTMVKEGCE